MTENQEVLLRTNHSASGHRGSRFVAHLVDRLDLDRLLRKLNENFASSKLGALAFFLVIKKTKGSCSPWRSTRWTPARGELSAGNKRFVLRLGRPSNQQIAHHPSYPNQ